jgi:hypothetical protein
MPVMAGRQAAPGGRPVVAGDVLTFTAGAADPHPGPFPGGVALLDPGVVHGSTCPQRVEGRLELGDEDRVLQFGVEGVGVSVEAVGDEADHVGRIAG